MYIVFVYLYYFYMTWFQSHFTKCFLWWLGQLTKRHTEIFLKNPLFVGVRIPEVGKVTPLEMKLPRVASDAMHWLHVSAFYCISLSLFIQFLWYSFLQPFFFYFAFLLLLLFLFFLLLFISQQSLIYDPDQRATTKQLMAHPYFQADGFADRFEVELYHIIELEREKEQADRLKRRKSKKVHYITFYCVLTHYFFFFLLALWSSTSKGHSLQKRATTTLGWSW